jgi:F0F1-type ATP synthase assembly protein I
MRKMSKTAAHPATPHTVTSGKNDSTTTKVANQRSQFLVMALNMSWQLAVVILVPVVAGTQLDKAFNTSNVYTFVGLGVALLGSIAVMWRTMQVANKLPVPKLTAEQKSAIQKQYEEDDKDA